MSYITTRQHYANLIGVDLYRNDPIVRRVVDAIERNPTRVEEILCHGLAAACQERKYATDQLLQYLTTTAAPIAIQFLAPVEGEKP